jgi:transposase InsO family protein
VKHVQQAKGVSERRACAAIGQPRSSQRFQSTKDATKEKKLLDRIHELIREHPRFGYRRIGTMLKREGWTLNLKRMYRLWKQEGLKVPKKQRKKRRLGSSNGSCIRHRATHKNHVWAWDFVHDRTITGAPLKWLTLVDEFTRECLSLKVNRSIRSDDLLDILRDLFLQRGMPGYIRSDNGPEFISRAVREWLTAAGVETLYVEPGSPWENGYSESFNSKLRDEFLNMEEFDNQNQAQYMASNWRTAYNNVRPHSSLGYEPPAEFASRCAASAPVAALPSLQQHNEETLATT